MTILHIFFESNLKPVGLLTGLYIEKCPTSVPIYFNAFQYFEHMLQSTGKH